MITKMFKNYNPKKLMYIYCYIELFTSYNISYFKVIKRVLFLIIFAYFSPLHILFIILFKLIG